ncbi:MAG: Heavy metal transport/detoxification protein [Pseudomonadota bacterium]|jgi:copper chaperone
MHTFKVEAMSCGHCAASVTRAVQSVDAQAKVQVDLAQGRVQVESTASTDALARAIVEAGYPAQPEAGSS